MQNSEIKILGKTYKVEDLKAGIQKKDITSNNEYTTSLFSSIDKTNENGFKDNVIDNNEMEDFWSKLCNAAGNKVLSEKEAQILLNNLNVKGAKIEDLKDLLDKIQEKSKEIVQSYHDNEHNSTVIEYKEGYFNEILEDGEHIVRPKEGKDSSKSATTELNVPFFYLGDYVINSNARKNLEDKIGKVSIDEIIKDLGLNPENKDFKFIDDGRTLVDYYTDDKGEIVLNIKNPGDKNQIIEYKKGDNWYVINSCSSLLGTKSVAMYNSDMTKLLTEITYTPDNKVYDMKRYVPETDSYQSTRYNLAGKIDEIIDYDERGFSKKVQYFDEFGEVKEIWVFERDPQSDIGAITKTLLYDKDMKLIKTEVFEDGKYNTYDASGNLIINEVSSPKSRTEMRKELYQKIENDFDNPETKQAIKEEVEYCKKLVDNILSDVVNNEQKQKARNYIVQKLDKCLELENPQEILKILKPFNTSNIAPLRNRFLNEINNEIPNGIIDKQNYQGNIGDCWLLGTLNSISELPKGNDFIKNLFSKDDNGNYIVKLEGGKVQYTITPEELNSEEHDNLSFGDADLKLLEIAFEKYFKEFHPGDRTDINGNKQNIAMEILTGNKTAYLHTDIDVSKFSIHKNGEDIEINEENLDKLKNIPINVWHLNKNILKTLAKFKDRLAINVSSHDSNRGHAYYIKEINENSITVKEPHNTGNTVTYSIEDFLQIYTYGISFIII